jgi:hypothetical protein
MALSKFNEFMHCLQHGHDANEAHYNFNITQELKTSSHSFNGMEIIIHFDDQRLILYKNLFNCVLTKNNIKTIYSPYFPTIMKTFITHGASWVKRKSKNMWFMSLIKALA